MSTPKQVKRNIESLSLGPGDILIVHDEADMQTLIEMTQQGVGFSQYANPILFIKGGIEKATENDLIDAITILRKHKEQRGPIIVRPS